MLQPAITRRHLLRGIGALGLALPAVGLAGCGGMATVATSSASSPATTTATQTATAQRAATSGSASTSQATKPAAATSVAPGTVQLVFMCDIGAPYTTVAQHWADTFPQTHAGVTVQYQPIVSNYNDKLTAAYAAGTPPDVYRYLQANTPIDAAVKDNLLLSLSSYADRDKYDFSDFLPQAIGLYQWQGNALRAAARLRRAVHLL